MYGFPDSWTGRALKSGVRSISRSMRMGSGSSIKFSGSALGIKLTYSRIVIWKPVLNYQLNNTKGMLGRYMHELGTKIVIDAKKQVGVKTGALRDSIHMRHLGNYTGQYLWIGSKKSYAYAHHEGTKPHAIVAKGPGSVLVFRSGSKIIRATHTMHPGTKPNRFLSDQLRRHIR